LNVNANYTDEDGDIQAMLPRLLDNKKEICQMIDMITVVNVFRCLEFEANEKFLTNLEFN